MIEKSQNGSAAFHGGDWHAYRSVQAEFNPLHPTNVRGPAVVGHQGISAPFKIPAGFSMLGQHPTTPHIGT
jgi:hypothetical protein